VIDARPEQPSSQRLPTAPQSPTTAAPLDSHPHATCASTPHAPAPQHIMALGGTSSVVMLDLAHSHGQMHRRMHLSCRTASPCHNASRSGVRLNLSSKDSTRPAAPPLHATMPLAPVFGSTSRARIVRALLGPSSVPRSRAQAPHSHARAKPPCTAWKRAVQIRPSVPSPPSSTIMEGCAQTPPAATDGMIRHGWLRSSDAQPQSPHGQSFRPALRPGPTRAS